MRSPGGEVPPVTGDSRYRVPPIVIQEFGWGPTTATENTPHIAIQTDFGASPKNTMFHETKQKCGPSYLENAAVKILFLTSMWSGKYVP